MWGERGNEKKIPSGKVVNEEMPQEEEQSGPWRLCNSLTESLNGESNDEEDELIVKCGDWGFSEICICDEYICPKCYEKKDISTDDFL